MINPYEMELILSYPKLLSKGSASGTFDGTTYSISRDRFNPDDGTRETLTFAIQESDLAALAAAIQALTQIPITQGQQPS